MFCIIVTDTCINIEGSVESFELTPRPGQRLCAAAAAASPPATDCLSNLPAPDTAPQGATWQQHQLYARSAPPAFLLQKSLGHQMVACMTRTTVSTFSQYFIFVKENEDRAWSHLT